MIQRIRLTRPVYRAHNPRWSFAPESGDGAKRHGGRFNRPGTPALYTSLRPEAAWAEAQQGFPFKAQPLTICQYDVDCTDMADLTDPAVLGTAGIDVGVLDCAWERIVADGGTPPSWTLVDRLRTEGVAGVLVRSCAPAAMPTDVNAVFWVCQPVPPHKVQVVDDEGRLPRDLRSWS